MIGEERRDHSFDHGVSSREGLPPGRRELLEVWHLASAAALIGAGEAFLIPALPYFFSAGCVLALGPPEVLLLSAVRPVPC